MTFVCSKVILHNVASCHAFYKDYIKACIYFKKLLDLEPENMEVMGIYGRVLAMAGNDEDSKKILENALHLAEERNEEQLIEQVCTKKIQHVKLCTYVLYMVYSTASCKQICSVKYNNNHDLSNWRSLIAVCKYLC